MLAHKALLVSPVALITVAASNVAEDPPGSHRRPGCRAFLSLDALRIEHLSHLLLCLSRRQHSPHTLPPQGAEKVNLAFTVALVQPSLSGYVACCGTSSSISYQGALLRTKM